MNGDEYMREMERKWGMELERDCWGNFIEKTTPIEHVTVCGVRGWMQRIDDRAEVDALIASCGGG